MQKIAIVGAGRVGESTAQFLAKTDLAEEIVLTDIRVGVGEGAALDIQETAPLFGFDTRVSGSTDAAALAGSDVVIITAGIPRKPGITRSDVLETNVRILDVIVDDIDISVRWDNAGAGDIDASIIQVLEPELQSVDGVIETSARSREGTGSMALEVEPCVRMTRRPE